jgi:hypothetical protein
MPAHKYLSSAQLTGTLIIDFQGQSDSNVNFPIGSTLTTASGSNIVVVNGNTTDGVSFQVGRPATLGTTTTFAGNILASDSITQNTGAKILCGRAIALNAAVTPDTNTISNDCALGGAFSTGRTEFGSFGFNGPVRRCFRTRNADPSHHWPAEHIAVEVQEWIDGSRLIAALGSRLVSTRHKHFARVLSWAH